MAEYVVTVVIEADSPSELIEYRVSHALGMADIPVRAIVATANEWPGRWEQQR
jgi:hypothetical protein